jgi:hypothetical protein
MRLGPGLGFVQEPLDQLDPSAYLPPEYPGASLLDDTIRSTAYDSGVTEDLRRANVWAAVLSKTVQHDPERLIPKGTALTTVGFVSVGEKIQLGVVHYLYPLHAFVEVTSHHRTREIEVGGWSFPVVIRPWLPIRHSSDRSFGNCWIKFSDESARRLAVLTAAHALGPKGASPGNWVSIHVLREPRSGRLIRTSEKMDAAIVEVELEDWDGETAVKPSSIFGYKPVLLLSSSGPQNGWIKEHTGQTIFGQVGQEPLVSQFLFMDRFLQPGDSRLSRARSRAPGRASVSDVSREDRPRWTRCGRIRPASRAA